jgi:hypothetical protein
MRYHLSPSVSILESKGMRDCFLSSLKLVSTFTIPSNPSKAAYEFLSYYLLGVVEYADLLLKYHKNLISKIIRFHWNIKFKNVDLTIISNPTIIFIILIIIFNLSVNFFIYFNLSKTIMDFLR